MEQTYARDINRLKEQDKKARQLGLQNLLKVTEHEDVAGFFSTSLRKPLLSLLSDPSEANKMLAVSLLKRLVQINAVSDDDALYVFAALFSRLDSLPFPEGAEEVRLALLQLLGLMLEKYTTPALMADICNVLSKACHDTYPNAKNEAALIVCKLAKTGENMGFYAKPVIASLMLNLGHQHGKVRTLALQAIGLVIQQEHAHGLFEEIAPVLKQICQFDRTVSVRKCLYEVLSSWLLHLPIAYLKTFEGKILYMLLGGLGDPETHDLIPEMLSACGERRLMLARELGEDITAEQGTVSADEFLVLKHLSVLLNLCLADLQEWSAHENYKDRASIVLIEILLRAKRHVTPHLDQVFKVILKVYSGSDKPWFMQKLVQSVQILGKHCDLSMLVDLTLRNSLTDAFPTSQKAGGLELFSKVLLCHTEESVESHIGQVLRLITQKDFCLSVQPAVLQQLVAVIEAFTAVAQGKCVPLTHTLFNVLLVIQNSSIKVEPVLSRLAQLAQITVADIYAQELPVLLPVITQDFLHWTADSSNRLSFKTLTMQAGYAVTKCWDQVMNVLMSSSQADKDVQVKLDALIILEHLLHMPELTELIRNFSQRILMGVVVPTATWRAGRAQVEVRKGAMICLRQLLKQSLLMPEVVTSEWSAFFPVVKTCLGDDYDWQLRFQACACLNQLLKHYGDSLEAVQFSDLYAELVARLDDAQDSLRIKACRGFEAFFIALGRLASFSNYRYIIDTLFIQLDDPSENIQAAVSRALAKAIPFRPEEFIASAEAALSRHRHPRAVNDLLSLAKSQ